MYALSNPSFPISQKDQSKKEKYEVDTTPNHEDGKNYKDENILLKASEVILKR